MITFGNRFKPPTAPTTPAVDQALQPQMPPPTPVAPMAIGQMPYDQLVQWIQKFNQQAGANGAQGQQLMSSRQFNPDGSAVNKVYSGRLGPDGVFRNEAELGELPGEGLDLGSMVKDPTTGQMVSRNTYQQRTGMLYKATLPTTMQGSGPGPQAMGGDQQRGPSGPFDQRGVSPGFSGYTPNRLQTNRW